MIDWRSVVLLCGCRQAYDEFQIVAKVRKALIAVLKWILVWLGLRRAQGDSRLSLYQRSQSVVIFRVVGSGLGGILNLGVRT